MCDSRDLNVGRTMLQLQKAKSFLFSEEVFWGVKISIFRHLFHVGGGFGVGWDLVEFLSQHFCTKDISDEEWVRFERVELILCEVFESRGNLASLVEMPFWTRLSVLFPNHILLHPPVKYHSRPTYILLHWKVFLPRTPYPYQPHLSLMCLLMIKEIFTALPARHTISVIFSICFVLYLYHLVWSVH